MKRWKCYRLSEEGGGDEKIVATLEGNYVFHVHTYRCGHASDDSDAAYVQRAIQMGAKSIIFTDHAPFPGDPFRNRMRSAQLGEYISALKALKIAYSGEIDVHIGLEAEFLPSYLSYYVSLRNNPDIDILMIGQHFFEIRRNRYSFELNDKEREHYGLCGAICEGIDTGLFDAVAHPDRVFRRIKTWTDELSDLSGKLIQAAGSRGVWLEKNYQSMQMKRYYRSEFWNLVTDREKIVYGCDAHAVDEMAHADTVRRSVADNATDLAKKAERMVTL